jgi:squalene-hopene/tetraprenyl-beta-curcumene cyclase
MNRRHWLKAAAALGCSILGYPALAGPDAPSASGPKSWDQVVDRAIRYLREAQANDGSWSEQRSPGITGVVLTGILSTGRLSLDDPMVTSALRYIESLVNKKEGHIAGKDPKVQLKNYVTSINVMALTRANRDDRYKKVIGDGVEFLKKLQWDEGEGKAPQDDFYGGAGYDSQSRPDLSNTQFFLDALQAAGIPKDDPALRKALIFVSRCQNLKGEHNDQPWAGKINDGSFIYSAAGRGQTKMPPRLDGGLPGYGSMTYAGIKSMIYCGVSREDPRIQEAYRWITRHYTLEANPGMPEDQAQWGLFYYYHTMAKCLSILGIDEVVDAEGRKHNWRADLIATLAKRQNANGGWRGVNHWYEMDPNLDTGYALMALGYCKPIASTK